MKTTILFLLMVFPLMTIAQSGLNEPSFLGVEVKSGPGRLAGVYIEGVYKGYAEKCRLQIGDTLKSVNGAAIRSSAELLDQLRLYKPGEQVELRFVRDGKPQFTTALVSTPPDFMIYRKYGRSKLIRASTTGDIRLAKLGIKGSSVWDSYALLVTGFPDASPARDAGVNLGDILLKLDEHEFATPDELDFALSGYKPGDRVRLTLRRDRQVKTLFAVLGEDVHYRNWASEEEDKKKKNP